MKPSRGRKTIRTCALTLILLLCRSSHGEPAEVMPVPPDLQIPLILKILTYDRNFQSWTRQSALRIGIVYLPDDPISTKAKDEILEVLRSFSNKTVKGVTINHSLVEYTSDSHVESIVKSDGINVFYIAPGNLKNLDSLLEISKDQQIITTTGVPEYVELGVAVGIGVRRKKPLILINLSSCKSAGSEFDASLLRIARVVR